MTLLKILDNVSVFIFTIGLIITCPALSTAVCAHLELVP